MRPRLTVLPLLVALAAVWAALLAIPAGAAAQCATTSAACVEFSPASGPPGTLVTVTPAAGESLLPVIQSADCAPNAKVNADFVKNGVVIALSPLSGSPSRAQFRVPRTAAGTYRIDLYCPNGNTAVTLEPDFQVLPPDTATLAPDAGMTPAPTTPLAAIWGLAFAVAVLAFSRVKLVVLDQIPRFGVRTIRLQDRRLSRRPRKQPMARPGRPKTR